MANERERPRFPIKAALAFFTIGVCVIVATQLPEGTLPKLPNPFPQSSDTQPTATATTTEKECVWINDWNNGGNRAAKNIPTICEAMRILNLDLHQPNDIFRRDKSGTTTIHVDPGCKSNIVVKNNDRICNR